MKRYLVAILCVLLFVACGGRKAGSVVNTPPADTIVATPETTVVDSVEDPLSNLPVPKALDDLFDDFIFNFAANKKLQRERILFPLKKINGDKVEIIEKDQWKIERYFMRQQYYTLLFDNEKQMEIGSKSKELISIFFTLFFLYYFYFYESFSSQLVPSA